MGRAAGRPHPSDRGVEVIRGAAGLLGAVALAAGVPTVLWLAVGWPLPHALPSLGEISDALSSSGIPDDFFPSALAILTWLAWSQFVACLAVEMRSALGGRMPRKVPGAGWGVQALAANLVAAVMLLVPGQGVAAVAMAATPAALIQTVQPLLGQPLGGETHGAADRAPGERSRPAAGGAEPAGRDLVRYVVRQRETLWSIAGRHLGDPLRWEEIFDLNKGRPQPDGRRMEDVNWIYPGWVLRLPPDAVGVPQAMPEVVPEVVPEEVPAGVPHLDRFPLGAEGGNGAVSVDELRTTELRAGELETTGLTRAGLLGAGLVALLSALRIVQQRRRGTGRRIALPEGGLATAERGVRAGQLPERAELVELAMRAMAAGMRRDGIEPPHVLGVLLGAEQLEVLLEAETSAAPEPFTLSGSRRRWRLAVDVPTVRLRELAGSMTSPLPGLVTIGADGDGLLMVNLEAAGLVALGGDETAARAVIASFAVELATCRWADFLELVLVGFGRELERLERVRLAGSVSEVLPWLERKAADAADALEELEAHSALGGRVAGAAPDTWTPTVLLCATPPTAEETARLMALTLVPSRSPLAAAIVTKDLRRYGWSLALPAEADRSVQVPLLHIDVLPQRLDPTDYRAVAGLLRTAAMPDVPARPSDQSVQTVQTAQTDPQAAAEPPRSPPPPRRLRAADPAAAEAADGAADAASEVEVRVLGRVEIAGIPRVERGKSEELMVFLALHPGGVDGDQLAEALWPSRPPARGTLNTTTAVARAYLGVTGHGQPRLPHARNGLYRLDPSVGVDWARLQALAASGFEPGAEGAGDLRRALELVRGRPFDGVRPRSYGWALLDEAPLMESTIVDVADRLAGMLLDAGDHAGTRWAARRGLLAAPYDERLYRWLMLAADAAGNLAGVESVMDELLLRLDEEGLEPYDSLHEETRALYEQLIRHRPNHRHSNAG